MTEVFITNLQNKIQADRVLYTLWANFPGLKINFDIKDTNLSFPCGHTILRVEGKSIGQQEIITLMDQLGFKCEILEDKICKR